MNINKIGAFIAHAISCGVFAASSYFTDGDLLQGAIFIELMAIYFNTKKED